MWTRDESGIRGMGRADRSGLRRGAARAGRRGGRGPHPARGNSGRARRFRARESGVARVPGDRRARLRRDFATASRNDSRARHRGDSVHRRRRTRDRTGLARRRAAGGNVRHAGMQAAGPRVSARPGGKGGRIHAWTRRRRNGRRWRTRRRRGKRRRRKTRRWRGPRRRSREDGRRGRGRTGGRVRVSELRTPGAPPEGRSLQRKAMPEVRHRIDEGIVDSERRA